MRQITNIFIAFFVLTSAFASAQEKTLPVFLKRSEPLTRASGWMQSKVTGQVSANDNLILGKQVAPSDSADMGSTPQNLIWMRTATIRYNGKKYYTFYYHYLSGKYKYPDTKTFWTGFTATKFIIVDSVQYYEFKKAVLGKRGVVASARTKISNNNAIEGPYDDARLLQEMGQAFENKENNIYSCFTAKTQILDGRDIARFRLPENCYNNKDLPTDYFEISYEDFKKIFVE